MGWEHDEATPTNLQTPPSQDESKITICRLSRSKINPYQDHTKALGGQHRLSRRPVDALEDLEIHLPVLTDKELRSLDTEWHPSTQLRKLLVKGLLRWLVAAMLVSVIYCVLYSFHKKPVMDDKSKKVFNLLIIGASLALGLNIANSLKGMAVDFRWWLLAHKKRPLREVAQVGLAILGLTFSVESQSTVATTRNGTVQTPDLSQIYPELNSTTNSQTIGAQQYAANNFGIIALSFPNNWTDSKEIPQPETLWTPVSNTIFYATDLESLLTVVLDFSSDYQIAIFTNRTINSTWSCKSYIVLDGGNGSSHDVQILLNTNKSTTSKYVPITAGLDQATFMTDPDKNDCGSGCSTVEVFESSATQAWWYTCNITISNTTNAMRPEHFVGQSLAKMAASAIALQGYRISGQNTTTQYQYYPAASNYGYPASGNSDAMGRVIGYFAIGAVAAAIRNNPNLAVPGNEPGQGVALSVDWVYVHLILIFMLGGQIFLFIVSCLVSNMVVVKDDSPISVARLLRPIVERLGNAGGAASGKKICEVLSKADEGLGRVGYTVVHPVAGRRHHLVLGDHKMLRAFPPGYYN
ncbi:hypothetical protein DL95DRAFT_319204 [Leptodontidium sp. 2 PMI_412]|nr:hypothetical protein DL95DRAFT_319204 [Leptodontidium sp. 2 PMI_412]